MSRDRSAPSPNRKAKIRPPVRVRHDPPTIDEAIFAAQGMIDDPRHQIAFAAELMGVSIAEVEERYAAAQAATAAAIRAEQGRVMVERRSGQTAAVVVERTRPAFKRPVVVEMKSRPPLRRMV